MRAGRAAERAESWLPALGGPAALRERGETIARLARDDPAGLAAFFAPDLSATDREQQDALDPATAARMLENLREAFRQGADAYVEDHTINNSDWAYLLPGWPDRPGSGRATTTTTCPPSRPAGWPSRSPVPS